MVWVGRECRVRHEATAELLTYWRLDLDLFVGETQSSVVEVEEEEEEEDTETVAFVVAVLGLGSDLEWSLLEASSYDTKRSESAVGPAWGPVLKAPTGYAISATQTNKTKILWRHLGLSG